MGKCIMGCQCPPDRHSNSLIHDMTEGPCHCQSSVFAVRTSMFIEASQASLPRGEVPGLARLGHSMGVAACIHKMLTAMDAGTRTKAGAQARTSRRRVRRLCICRDIPSNMQKQRLCGKYESYTTGSWCSDLSDHVTGFPETS